ncbi:MAG TPA: hypothetical protein VFT57_00195 [Gemmatimonadaceae bacterium]|nr:hypothetical protein [Gemmatimonadaceae bacterium]
MLLRFIPIVASSRRLRRTHFPSLAALAVALVVVPSGCASDAAVAPPPRADDPQMYWSLTLDHHAVTLSTVAPYDTIRLTATPRTADGTTLTDAPAPTFESLDLDRMVVSADGLVRAIKTGDRVPVVAALTVGDLSHVDTAYVNITDIATPPTLATLSIHPDPGDSAKLAMNTTKFFVPKARAADSTLIDGLAIDYQSLDPTVAVVDRAWGLMWTVRPGHVKVVAAATAYGVTRADTVQYTVGYPINLWVTVQQRTTTDGRTINVFVPDHVEIGPGGGVVIVNSTGKATDVTFDDPTNVIQTDLYCGVPYDTYAPWLCAAGNIDAFTADSTSDLSAWRARTFPVPGTYNFRSTIFGTTGTIVVVDESTDIP